MFVDNGSIQFIGKMKNMEAMHKENQEDQGNLMRPTSRIGCRKTRGRLRWVHEHMELTSVYSFSRVSLPDKGERVGRRGRKATGQGWALIAGLPKEQFPKRQRTCQDFRAY